MKDTLIIVCSGTGFAPKALTFLEKQVGEYNDYDVLAIPGGIHSLCVTAFLPKYKWAISHWVKFLVETHNLKRVIALDHDDCAWFEKLSIAESAVMGKSQYYSLNRARETLLSLLPDGIALEVWRAYNENDEIKFEKVK